MLNQVKKLPPMDDESKQTVTSLYASQFPAIKCPKDAAENLFHKPLHFLRSRINQEIFEHEITEDELNFAAEFGRFGQRPSNLFLKLFHNVLNTLARDPLCGRVSPSLIGSSGVIPLTIISTIPDIMQHYYHCIVHAQKEVLLATNYWEKSQSVTLIGKALRDLSKRAGSENRHIIFKLIIDHPTKENLAHYHSILPVKKWSHYDIPLPEEIPNISLEVLNYHRMIMGTFHSKFMVVDRRVALLNSNNIQDRPNTEMMSHFEGDIVNSFYDTYLISWWIPFEPNLVCLNDEAPADGGFEFGMDSRKISSIKQPLHHAIAKARLRLRSHFEEEVSDIYLHAPITSNEEECFISISENQNANSDKFSTIALTALVNHRKAHSPCALVEASNNLASAVAGCDITPRSDPPLTGHLNEACKSERQAKPDGHLSKDELEKLNENFTPFVFHRPHQPFPIALVNRLPHGAPGHTDTANPQDAAWLAAFRYAEKSIFIQSPTLNAKPAIDGIIYACQRGVKVILWLDLGFNDSKEGLGTFQGGTNEHVVKKLYKTLKKENNGAENFLEVYWYIGIGLFVKI
jgi:phosphatidylserine/phosphatidylglycerophosphate/cardiolipin synthase-like enzyme